MRHFETRRDFARCECFYFADWCLLTSGSQRFHHEFEFFKLQFVARFSFLVTQVSPLLAVLRLALHSLATQRQTIALYCESSHVGLLQSHCELFLPVFVLPCHLLALFSPLPDSFNVTVLLVVSCLYRIRYQRPANLLLPALYSRRRANLSITACLQVLLRF